MIKRRLSKIGCKETRNHKRFKYSFRIFQFFLARDVVHDYFPASSKIEFILYGLVRVTVKSIWRKHHCEHENLFFFKRGIVLTKSVSYIIDLAGKCAFFERLYYPGRCLGRFDSREKQFVKLHVYRRVFSILRSKLAGLRLHISILDFCTEN